MDESDDGKGLGSDGGPPRIAEYSSPPCLLHELDPAFLSEAERYNTVARAPSASAAQDWAEVRFWRKAKRAVLIERRLAIPEAARAAHGAAITAPLAELLSPWNDRLIGFYWPFKGEYDPRRLARSLHARGARLALPVVIEKARPLIFREWWPGAPMTLGVWNIPIPAAGDPVTPDVLLVPLVGFDSQKYRLGYGGGYYDRTIAALPTKPWTVGVGFESSQIATIHPQPHDIAMDLIVTERRTL